MEAGDSREAMLQGYVAVASRSWEDDGFKQLLRDAPRDALAAHGFPVPDGTDVVVTFVDPRDESGSIPPADRTVEEWVRQLREGRLNLAICDRPPKLATAELTDDQVEGLVGGVPSLSLGRMSGHAGTP